MFCALCSRENVRTLQEETDVIGTLQSQSLFSLYPLSYYYLQAVAQPTPLSTNFKAQKSEIEDSHIN